jgi:hypothetical protein
VIWTGNRIESSNENLVLLDWESVDGRLRPVAVMGRRYVVASGIALLCLAVALLFFLDFRGNLDHGNFEVLRTVKNSENKIAIVAKRSDDEALSGDWYFVLVADHVYSHKELRLASDAHDLPCRP